MKTTTARKLAIARGALSIALAATGCSPADFGAEAIDPAPRPAAAASIKTPATVTPRTVPTLKIWTFEELVADFLVADGFGYMIPETAEEWELFDDLAARRCSMTWTEYMDYTIRMAHEIGMSRDMASSLFASISTAAEVTRCPWRGDE